jgi:hypothetical protein
MLYTVLFHKRITDSSASKPPLHVPFPPLPSFVLFSFLFWQAAEDTQDLTVLLSALERTANEPLARTTDDVRF